MLHNTLFSTIPSALTFLPSREGMFFLKVCIVYTVYIDIFVCLCFIVLISSSRIFLGKKVSYRNFPAVKQRPSRCTTHRNSTCAGQPAAISRRFFISAQKLKLVTCSLSNGDPITALKSLPVTMLICTYLHMMPQKSEANWPRSCPLFLARLPEIVRSTGGLVRHFQSVKVVQASFLELQLKCPH